MSAKPRGKHANDSGCACSRRPPESGGDLTYPLQFGPGARINTAGSGNDVVGSTKGYENVEFNRLPALSNGYIVAGL